jgi:ornithine cyclodeaminase/alanine dehydrogenase-like protein (mu-crystallin family)
MRILSRPDIEQLIDMREVIALMRELFVEIGSGSVAMPQRSAITLRGGKDTVLFMPGHVGRMNSVGVKVVSVFPDNPATNGRSTINATVLLNDAETGEILAMMDGGHVTALRTAAVSAVATDLLALAGGHRLGVFGAGVQARSHVEAILAVRPIDCVSVYAPNQERARGLVDAFRANGANGCRFDVAPSPDAIASGCDIIVTATTSRTPVFDGRLLAPGTHVNAIGAFRPQDRELDDETIRRARVFVDSRDQAMAEAGDVIIPIASGTVAPNAVLGDLAELVANRHCGRQSPEDITVFKSVGLAVEDIVVAALVLKKAAAANVGTVV